MEKFIDGYENLYSVNEKGEVFSHYKNRLLTWNPDGYGYYYVNLTKDGKRKCKKVHRIVAETFLPNPENLPCVNHKDEDKSNNDVSNLEWCSYSYNNSYGTRMDRVKQSIIDNQEHKQKRAVVMCDKTTHEELQIFNSVSDASRFVKGSHANICACLQGRQKTSYGYWWKYLED